MEASAALHGVHVVLDDRVVLRDVDLELGPGLTVVRGRNGAGKTSLLRTLAGALAPTRGTVSVLGERLYLGHRPQLHRALSATRNLAFFARYRGLPTAPIAAALTAWGVGEIERPVERLSAGQRRRVSLARLDTEPCAVLLLDEPFAELDDDAAARLEARLAALAAQGRAILVATHGRAALPATRTLEIDDGRLA